MKIAVVTEGTSEFKSLPRLFDQLAKRSRNEFISPLLAVVHPEAPPSTIAARCLPSFKIAKARQANRVVLLLDREGRVASAGQIARDIQQALTRKGCPSGLDVHVVIKDRAFENWLVADVQALREQPKRFKVSDAHVRRVEPNKADNCDAERLLSEMKIKGSYHKVQDSFLICNRIDVARAALNSRSFRHLLHVIGDPVYKDKCCRPAISRH